MLSTRLSPQVESRLNDFAATYGLTKSAVTEAALSDYMSRIQSDAKKKLEARRPTVQEETPSQRVLRSLEALSRQFPNQDFDWKEARDEGKK
jgi:hypothetical protein